MKKLLFTAYAACCPRLPRKRPPHPPQILRHFMHKPFAHFRLPENLLLIRCGGLWRVDGPLATVKFNIQDKAAGLVTGAPVPPDVIVTFRAEANSVSASMGRISDAKLRRLAEFLPAQARSRFIDQIRSFDGDAKRLDIEYEESLEVARRYHNWLMLERRFEASVGESE